LELFRRTFDEEPILPLAVGTIGDCQNLNDRWSAKPTPVRVHAESKLWTVAQHRAKPREVHILVLTNLVLDQGVECFGRNGQEDLNRINM
jgi:hypothetical protein